MVDDLFSQPPSYPHAPGHAKGSRTSRKAAETVWRPNERHKLILAALGDRPMTDHELCAALGKPMAVLQPRRSELAAQGLVMESGYTRITPYGKEATVWRKSSSQPT